VAGAYWNDHEDFQMVRRHSFRSIAPRRHSDSRGRNGFTLIEFLIVCSIIVLLISLFFPAINYARRASRKMQCSNSMKQIAIALQNYHDTKGAFPAGWISHAGTKGSPGWGWMTATLEYAEQTGVAKSITQSESIGNPVNTGAASILMQVYHCEADRGLDVVKIRVRDLSNEKGRLLATKIQLGPSSYVGNFGSYRFDKCDTFSPDQSCDGDGIFYRNSFVRIRDIEDGTSHTILVGERRSDGVRGVWSGLLPLGEHGPGRLVSHAAVTPNDDSDRYGFSSFHLGGVNMVFGDGAVRFVRDEVDPQVFRAIATKNGDELRTQFGVSQ